MARMKYFLIVAQKTVKGLLEIDEGMIADFADVATISLHFGCP